MENIMNVGFLVGSLLPTFLLSRLFLLVLKKWNENKKKIVTVHVGSLICCALIGGMGMADGGAFVPIKSLLMYLPGQLAWMIFDYIRFSRKDNLSKESVSSVTCDKEKIEEDNSLVEESHTEDEDSDLTEEQENEFANKVFQVKAFCELAVSHIDCQDGSGSEEDIYEKERLEKKIKKSLAISQTIHDEFYRSAALHSISELLAKANQYERAEKIIELIEVDFIQEQAREFLLSQKKSNLEKL